MQVYKTYKETVYDTGVDTNRPHIRFLKWNMKRLLMEFSLKSKTFLKSEMKK